MKSIVKSLTKSGDDLGTEYVIDLLNRFELSADQHRDLADYCKKIGIQYVYSMGQKSVKF